MARSKRRGVIRKEAALLIWNLAQTLPEETAKVFARNVERWLNNGHNLDEADIEWLAQESKDAIAGQQAARELSEPELPVITVSEEAWENSSRWLVFISDGKHDGDTWYWPTLEHAVSSARSYLLREFAPRR